LRPNRSLLIQRSRYLERLGLATETAPGRWTLSPEAETTLRALGERDDIIKTMHRALQREAIDDRRGIAGYAIHGDRLEERVVGRVIDKGLGRDELADRVRLVIDGIDGRVHHVELPTSQAEEIGRGMIVGAEPRGPSAADRNIAGAADTHGVYRPSEHREQIRLTIEGRGRDPDAFIRSHIRRLEALRRDGLVERIHADEWRVPPDLVQRGERYDRAHSGDVHMTILSPFDLPQQITHDGATWLDRELVSREKSSLAQDGFGEEAREAMEARKRVLIERGEASDLGNGRTGYARDLVRRLEAGEIERAGKALAADRGLHWQPIRAGEHVAGQLVGSTRLAAGRFAMIDDGLGFSLVPWQPVLDAHIGRHVSGVAVPGGIDWSFGKQIGIGR
jgi:hypothetical protein